jgi:hypothetical protein
MAGKAAFIESISHRRAALRNGAINMRNGNGGP